MRTQSKNGPVNFQMRGRTQATKSRLVFVWPVIGIERGASFQNLITDWSKTKLRQTWITFDIHSKSNQFKGSYFITGSRGIFPGFQEMAAHGLNIFPFVCSSLLSGVFHALVKTVWTGDQGKVWLEREMGKGEEELNRRTRKEYEQATTGDGN